MIPEALELAKAMRDLLVLASSATIAVHIGLVGLAWFKRAGRAIG